AAVGGSCDCGSRSDQCNGAPERRTTAPCLALTHEKPRPGPERCGSMEPVALESLQYVASISGPIHRILLEAPRYERLELWPAGDIQGGSGPCQVLVMVFAERQRPEKHPMEQHA